jgi:hypothetical protein
LSCFGCCGNSYKSKEKILEGIRKNTQEYLDSGGDLGKFLDKPTSVRPCGVCRNIVLHSENQVFCPAHPLVNDGVDYRDKVCNKDYNCRTKKEFESWDYEKQLEFIEYIRSLDLDFIDFSMKIDNGELLKAFNKRERD